MSIPTYKKNAHKLTKMDIRRKPEKILIFEMSMHIFIFLFSYSVYHNKLVIRTKNSVHTAEINND